MTLDRNRSRGSFSRRCLGSISIGLLVSLATPPSAGQSQLWIQQTGTPNADYGYAAAPDDSGGAYLSGATSGALGGPNAGKSDAWLARYDSGGSQLWIRQLGTSFDDQGNAAAPDGSGGVYIGGWTVGSLGGPNAGSIDGWLARYDKTGGQIWIRQLGTVYYEKVIAAAPDGSGGVYVAGETGSAFGGPTAGSLDAWVARYDSSGNQLWTRQLGTSLRDAAWAAAPDGAGGAYFAGWTEGSLGGPYIGGWTDAWLARYDGDGNLLWIRQLGTNFEEVASAAAPDSSGGVYVCTYGLADSEFTRFDSAGNALWSFQVGAALATTYAVAATSDASGGVFLSGYTDKGFGPNMGGGITVDAFVVRYDQTGTQLWAQQFGTPLHDIVHGAVPDGMGGVLVGGETNGTLGGPNQGGYDGWLARYEGTCSVASIYCTAKTNSAGCLPAIAASGYPSASAVSGFTISTRNVLDNKFGVYFYSKTGANSVPFQGGILCAQVPLVRTMLQNSAGTAPCGGTFQMDFNAYVASGKDPGLVAGQKVWVQSWSRDPGFAPPNNTSLSDAITFTLCP